MARAGTSRRASSSRLSTGTGRNSRRGEPRFLRGWRDRDQRRSQCNAFGGNSQGEGESTTRAGWSRIPSSGQGLSQSAAGSPVPHTAAGYEPSAVLALDQAMQPRNDPRPRIHERKDRVPCLRLVAATRREGHRRCIRDRIDTDRRTQRRQPLDQRSLPDPPLADDVDTPATAPGFAKLGEFLSHGTGGAGGHGHGRAQ